MVPLAMSSSGLAVISGSVAFSVLLLAWMLRAETREEAAEQAAGEREGAKREQ
ncbi:MAG TPA: hypothetical protein VMF09_01000 [Solirubrobacteraceae bacterium]|nr:hypothetical protein [Solirubrobacteraceae bacterium]